MQIPSSLAPFSPLYSAIQMWNHLTNQQMANNMQATYVPVGGVNLPAWNMQFSSNDFGSRPAQMPGNPGHRVARGLPGSPMGIFGDNFNLGGLGLWSHGYVQGAPDYQAPIRHQTYGFDFGPVHQQLGTQNIPMPSAAYDPRQEIPDYQYRMEHWGQYDHSKDFDADPNSTPYSLNNYLNPWNMEHGIFPPQGKDSQGNTKGYR